jgi:hypothetical protein
MLSYILLCVCSLGRLLLVLVPVVAWCFFFYFYLLYHYVWCWRGPNHYPLYVLSYIMSYILLCVCSHAELYTTLCVQSSKIIIGTLCVQSWQSMVGTGTTCWCILIFFVYFHLFIALWVVLKGSKPLPSIHTKQHAELHTTLCVQSWQIIVGTGTGWCVVLFCFYFYLLYHYVWCWRGPNHYPLYILSYIMSYILLCVCSHAELYTTLYVQSLKIIVGTLCVQSW